jgi:maleylacetoacetate isomerase
LLRRFRWILLKGDQFDPAYRALNPEMVVPTLLDGGGPPLMQSLAILEYLEEKYPQSPLLPDDLHARAHVRALAQMLAMDAHPFIVPRVRKYLEQELHLDEPTRMKWLRHWLDLGSRTVEDLLARDPRTGRFCWGDRLTIADICLVAHLTSAKMLCDSDPAPYPTARRIFDACSSKHSRWNIRCGRRVRRRRHPYERMGRVRLTGLATCGRMCALVFRGVRLPDNLENCYHYATCRTIWKSPFLVRRRRHAIPTRSNRSK